MEDKKRVLILCTGNSARSQMAEGLLKNIVGDKFEVFSAGTIATYVRPEAITALGELGIDISNNRSKSVEEFVDRDIDYVLTVCDNAKQNCPYFPAKTKLVHHAFDDPAFVPGDEARLNEFRRVRDELKTYLETDFVRILGNS